MTFGPQTQRTFPDLLKTMCDKWESGHEHVREEESFAAGRRHLHQGQRTKHGAANLLPHYSTTTKHYKNVLKTGHSPSINICLPHLLHHCSYLLIISNNSTNMCRRHVLKHARHRQQQQQRFFQGQVIYIVVLLSLAVWHWHWFGLSSGFRRVDRFFDDGGQPKNMGDAACPSSSQHGRS